MSVSPAAAVGSPAPAKPVTGLGPFEGADFSDPKVRLEVYKRFSSVFAKETGKLTTFSACCGSAAFGDGGIREMVRGPGEPGEPVFNDGTYTSVLDGLRKKYSQEFCDWYHKTSVHYYCAYDWRCHTTNGNTHSEESAKELVEASFRSTASQMSTTNKQRLISCFGLTSQEAAAKWFTEGVYKTHWKGFDYEDPDDGKFCLIWVDAP